MPVWCAMGPHRAALRRCLISRKIRLCRQFWRKRNTNRHNGAYFAAYSDRRRAQSGFLYDAPVSVGLLARLGNALVEIHGQNESQALTDAATQRRLLDQFAGIDEDVRARRLHSTKLQLEKRLAISHREALARAAEEADYLTNAVAELQTLEPQTGEEETLADQRTLLMNAEKIAADLDEARNFLGNDSGVETALNAALRRLEKAAPEAAGN